MSVSVSCNNTVGREKAVQGQAGLEILACPIAWSTDDPLGQVNLLDSLPLGQKNPPSTLLSAKVSLCGKGISFHCKGP